MTPRRTVGLLATATLLVSTTATPAHADDVRDGQWYLQPLGITAAHRITTGAGVTVAVVDSGVDGSVADMAGAVAGGKDFSGRGSANGQQPVDGDSHGTNVASVLAARGQGGNGVIGAAPGARLLSASVYTLARDSSDQVAAAVRWSVDNGAKVINVSLGGSVLTAERAAYRYAQSKDVVVVAGSGNDGASRSTGTCALAGVVCVGGIDKDLRHDPDSNTDPRLSIVGPYATRAGASQTADTRAGIPVVQPGSAPTDYTGQSGTSLAAPVVAGVVALIRAKFPDLDAANVVNRLVRTATPAGSGRPNSTYGWGIVDAERAVTADVAPVRANPLGSLVSASSTPASNPPTDTPTNGPTGSKTNDRIIDATNDGGSNIGVVVGVVVAVVVAGAAAALVLVRRSRSRAR